MSDFWVIDLCADGVNVSTSMQVVGMPTLTAINGLVHALGRCVGTPVISWSFGYRRCEVLDGHMKAANYEALTTKKGETNAGIIDRMTAQVEGSLILELEEAEDAGELRNQLEDQLEHHRLSGGALRIGDKGVMRFPSALDAFRQIHSTHLAAHFFIEDYRSVLNAPPSGVERKDWLMQLIARPVEHDERAFKTAYEGESMGYLVPMITSYQLLEEPVDREPVRDEVLHAYAEPLVGVVRMRSTPSIIHHLSSEDERDLPVFWQGSYTESSDTQYPVFDIESFCR